MSKATERVGSENPTFITDKDVLIEVVGSFQTCPRARYGRRIADRARSALTFHADGYRGGGNWIVEAFAASTPIGLWMLQ